MIKREEGFTVVELLVTLFVAGILLMAGFQLFTVALKSSASSSQQATISNIAYNYLQQYGAMAESNCAALGSYPLGPGGAQVNVAGVSNVVVTVTVDCANNAANDVSTVNVQFVYGTPSQTLTMSKDVNTNSSTITQNLTGWWPLNSTAIGDGCSISGVVITPDNSNATSGSGTCVYDVTGNHLNGIEKGGITQTSGSKGEAGGALSFNGTSGFIALPAISGNLTGPNGITFSVWANVTQNNSWERFIEIGNSTSGTGAASINNDDIEFANAATTLKLGAGSFNGSTGSAQTSSASTGEIVLNAWHNYAVTITSAGAAIFYKDGAQTGTATLTGYNTSASLIRHSNFIGGSSWIPNSSNTAFYGGSMEDVRMYNRVLTPTEISTNYKAGAL